jgi:pimeloyl-ACP methyl ester carboxylesterase
MGEPRITHALDGIELHSTRFGAGATTVIFIHGWSCGKSFWRGQTLPAARATLGNRQLVTLDLAGHGRSTAASEQRVWSMAAFGADVVAVADDLAAERIVLVGHSMGGPVALEAAMQLGDRCRLVLGVDTFTDAAFYGALPDATIAARCARFAADYAGTIAQMVERITAPTAAPALRAWIARTMARTDPAIGVAVLAQLLAWDIEARWPSVRCPVATINSAPLARQGRQLALAGLAVRELDGVGHFPMLEAPAAFAAGAREIYDAVVSAAGRAAMKSAMSSPRRLTCSLAAAKAASGSARSTAARIRSCSPIVAAMRPG